MSQLAMFEAAPAVALPPIKLHPRRLARKADPETSQEAASRVEEFASGHHEMILGVLRSRGPLTPHEIAAYCALDAHEVGKRMKELSDAGRIKVVIDGEGKEMKRATPSGRHARVWFAV